MRWLAVRNHQIDASLRLLLAHNLNSTDALHLRVALQIQEQLYKQGDSLLFFSADQRLLRAASNEGLATFNPEMGTQAQLEIYLD